LTPFFKTLYVTQILIIVLDASITWIFIQLFLFELCILV